MRPYVVWFGEMPRFMEESADAIAGADMFVSIGTSGSVYPAAGFVMEARGAGVPCLELNLETVRKCASLYRQPLRPRDRSRTAVGAGSVE